MLSNGFVGGISLSQSEELDFFTFGQSAGALGACGAGFYADGTPGDASQPGNDCDIYEVCASAGYVSKGHDIETVPGNGVRDMYVEWHAVDVILSQSIGDDILDPCEDDFVLQTLQLLAVSSLIQQLAKLYLLQHVLLKKKQWIEFCTLFWYNSNEPRMWF